MNEFKDAMLIVDDDTDFSKALAAGLEREFDVTTAPSMTAAKRSLDHPFSVVLLDIRLSPTDPANQDGLVLLEDLHKNRPDLPVVVMTAFADVDVAVDAMKRGAWDFAQKSGLDRRVLRKIIQNVLERAALRRELYEARQANRRMNGWDMVGEHPSMDEVRNLIDMVAQDGYTNVLITGETGTGKELVASAIHECGRRNLAKFVDAHLATIPRELVAAELFGNVQGAYTDARESRAGKIEKANGGVLFLDEIGDVPMDTQVQLLRFLETRSFTRLGSTEPVSVDVQVVCATNRKLDEAIREGRFREDLYYRLKTVEIALPPLRVRIDDVPLLVDHFLCNFREAKRTKLAGITPAAIARLMEYSYPGNVRELRTIVEQSMLAANTRAHSMIEAGDLPVEVQRGVSAPPTAGGAIDLGELGVNLDEELARIEMAYIQEALRSTEGRKTDAWRLLGLNDRFTLRRRIKRIGESYAHLIDAFPLVRKLYYE